MVPATREELQGWAFSVFRCSWCLNITPTDYHVCITRGTLHGIWQPESSDAQAPSRAREPTMDPVQVEPEGAEAEMDASSSAMPANAFISRHEYQGVVHRAVHAEAWEIPERQIEEWCKSNLENDLGAQAYLLSADPGASRTWETLNSTTDPGTVLHHRDMAVRGCLTRSLDSSRRSIALRANPARVLP